MSIAESGFITMAGVTPYLIATQAASEYGLGEYGIVGLCLALAFWSLRDSYQRRVEDAKQYAESLRAVKETSRIAALEAHKETMEIVARQSELYHAILAQVLKDSQLIKEEQ